MNRMIYSRSVGALGVLFWAFGLTAPSNAANLFTSQHGDVFAIGYEEGELEPHVHIEGGIVNGVFVADEEYEPDDIVTVVPSTTYDYIASIGGRPPGSEWTPVGSAAGESFWLLPQNDSGAGGADVLNAPFAGIGTEELNAGDWSSDLSIQLVAVDGPGDFSLWQTGLAPTFFMSTADGLDGSDVFSMGAGGHDHANFGFTAPGIYDLTVRVSGTHAVDGFKSADATYSFAVVPEPSTGLILLIASSSLLIVRRERGV